MICHGHLGYGGLPWRRIHSPLPINAPWLDGSRTSGQQRGMKKKPRGVVPGRGAFYSIDARRGYGVVTKEPPTGLRLSLVAPSPARLLRPTVAYGGRR